MASIIEGLPDAVSLQCLARVPLSSHPHMRSVNHSWRSLLYSKDFFKLRSEIGSSEPWLYVSAHEPDKTWQTFNPSTGTWYTIPPLPSSIKNLSNFGSVSVDGKLYIIGGDDMDDVDPVTGDHGSISATNEMWIYDPIYRKWSPGAPMLVARTRFACSPLSGGCIIVAGGITSTQEPTSTAEIYHPSLDRWEQIADLRQTRNSSCVGVLLDDDAKPYAIHAEAALAQAYDAVHNKWTVVECTSVQRPIGAVSSVPYTIFNDIVVRDSGKTLYSRPSIYRRLSFGFVHMLEELYILGGVTLPRSGDLNLEQLSDVLAFRIDEGGRPSWREVQSMTVCKGSIRGCVVLTL